MVVEINEKVSIAVDGPKKGAEDEVSYCAIVFS